MHRTAPSTARHRTTRHRTAPHRTQHRITPHRTIPHSAPHHAPLRAPDRTGQSPKQHTQQSLARVFIHCGPLGSGPTSPGPRLTSRYASKTAAQGLGQAIRTPAERGYRGKGDGPLILTQLPSILASCQRMGSSPLLRQGRPSFCPPWCPRRTSGPSSFLLVNPQGFRALQRALA